MLKLSTRHQIVIGVALVVLMVATRGHHFPTVKNLLPSASWAVFFLAGVYLRPAWILAALFGLAAFLDFAAVNWQGISDFCVSPAYIALIPAYGALWFAGRWFAGRYSFRPATLLLLAGSALVGTIVCELISSGSFYFFSGRFPETTLAEFGARLVKYAPHGLLSMAFWIGLAALAHAIVVTTYNSLAKPKLS
jgi:hypothetical protein